MCYLPGGINTMSRSMPLFQVHIKECEAPEMCMRNGTGDTSNIGGMGLG